jgi:hypothetical protein
VPRPEHLQRDVETLFAHGVDEAVDFARVAGVRGGAPTPGTGGSTATRSTGPGRPRRKAACQALPSRTISAWG